MAINPRAEPFFFYMTLLMIAIIVAGFGSSALYLPEFPFPPTPLLIFHGVVTLAWYILTGFQLRLISQSRFDLHRKLGQLSAGIVLTIVVTGYIVVSDAIRDPSTSIGGMDAAASTIFPSMDLLGFILFYSLGLANRKNSAAHKRLMVLAGLMMLPPATARLGLTVGFEPMPGVAALVLAGAFLIYDWRTRRRPHWASVLGLLIAFGGAPVRFLLGPTETWANFANAFY